ncbi:hypothetical protein PZE06_05420 [Robertmurraya sp. DFI.2.37]|uniref:hypothetical protein n=1 Tax=Robertmurraya sp. DFI.2.37 TaxID=3031819 RepID=UPI001246A8F4|nr:hypothetical protein [Robertmurraya sp. DFI.2.37]MDF1507620.1 hypothetical protein [Robertmurraya sp. DFI.2.37]
MTKKTWVNVNGTFRNVKSVWVKINDIWKKCVPKGKVDGIWKEFIIYMKKLYTDGVEEVPFEGIGTGSITKYSDRMFIIASGGVQTRERVVTVDMIDITAFNKLFIEWSFNRKIGANSARFGAVLQKSGYGGNIFYNSSQSFSKKIDFVDISQLSGEFYLYAEVFQGNADFSGPEVNVYKMWLE